MGLQPILEAAQAEEGFIDRVDFKIGGEVCQHPHDAGADVAVEGVIAGAHGYAVPVEAVFVQVPGSAHFDAKGLGLVAAGNHAAVVVGQHHYGFAA